MARQAVPTVLTGDAWSAAQHNTYIKDNEAAHWPYTTQGDMAYATSSTVLARLAKGTAFQHMRMNSGATAPEWVSAYGLFVFTGAAARNGAWDGDLKTVGTYVLNASGFTGGGTIPSTAKAILVALSARWSATSDASTCNLIPEGATANNGLVVRALVPSFFMDNMGIVPLSSSGQFNVIVSNDSADVVIDIWGYFQ